MSPTASTVCYSSGIPGVCVCACVCVRARACVHACVWAWVRVRVRACALPRLDTRCSGLWPRLVRSSAAAPRNRGECMHASLQAWIGAACAALPLQRLVLPLMLSSFEPCVMADPFSIDVCRAHIGHTGQYSRDRTISVPSSHSPTRTRMHACTKAVMRACTRVRLHTCAHRHTHCHSMPSQRSTRCCVRIRRRA